MTRPSIPWKIFLCIGLALLLVGGALWGLLRWKEGGEPTWETVEVTAPTAPLPEAEAKGVEAQTVALMAALMEEGLTPATREWEAVAFFDLEMDGYPEAVLRSVDPENGRYRYTFYDLENGLSMGWVDGGQGEDTLCVHTDSERGSERPLCNLLSFEYETDTRKGEYAVRLFACSEDVMGCMSVAQLVTERKRDGDGRLITITTAIVEDFPVTQDAYRETKRKMRATHKAVEGTEAVFIKWSALADNEPETMAAALMKTGQVYVTDSGVTP